ncbi:hypothetical protein K439DRAFT_1634370 [Ramaria rubella]|nr:hypothetical protein K439DRAFT_1634370 [Ramaria rubella]
MSSRHSSISRSNPRRWRSPTKSTEPQPSVSLVFAEPERDPISGGSAAAVLLPTQKSSEAVNTESSPPSNHAQRDAASSLRRASQVSLNKRMSGSAVPYDVDPVAADATGTTAKGEDASMSSTTPIPPGPSTLAPEPNRKQASRQTSQRAGWFSSLGRRSQVPPMESKDEPMKAAETTGPSEQASKVDSSPSTSYPRSGSAADSTHSLPAAIPFPATTSDPEHKQTEVKTRPANGGGWFSSASSIPGSGAPLESIVSSPVLPSIEPRELSSPQDIPQRKSANAESSGHPSPTKNTPIISSVDDRVPVPLTFSPPSSLPLLPSVRPRERTNSNLSTLNPSSSRFVLSMPLLGRPKVPLEQVVAHVERERGASNPPRTPEMSSTTQKVEIEQGTTPSEAGSWWGYLRLASSSSVALPSSPPPPSPVSTAKSHPSTLDSPIAAGFSDTTHHTADPASVPAPSVTSVDSVSTWYTPWRWYGSSTVLAASTSESEPSKTQAELIKEEALARPESGPSTPPAPLPNPVLGDVETRASWVSFFSSRTIATANSRTIKEKGEVMETMHLDDETTPSAATAPAVAGTPSDKKVPQEPLKDKPTVPPLTKDIDTKRQPSSPVSKKAVPSTPPRKPNLVLPTFEDTFGTPPRSIPLPRDASTIRRTIRYMSGLLFPEEDRRGKGKAREGERETIGRELPRTWDVLGDEEQAAFGGLKDVKRIIVIGIHGWFPGSIIRQVIGEPTGTSQKFANMLASAVENYFIKHDGTLEKLTKIVLEGEGTIERRVNTLYQEYLNHADWVEDLQKSDAILVATHSQGTIVSTQLLDRLISEGHIRTPKTQSSATSIYAAGDPLNPEATPAPAPQRVCCVAMCGIHLGPLLYLNTSSLVNPYLQYFESAAARELFEFQDSESTVSKTYVKALSNSLGHGIKFTYIASMDDQVVPIYSGCFSTGAHPLILRALYIDGEAYNSSDFLLNLLVLLFRIRNAGLDDGGLITHLSEATAGSLSGVGHSSAYEEPATYALAVRFLFETSGALGVHPELDVQPFTARAARNDYEIPWALRDLIANPDVADLFSSEFSELRAAFDDWHPRTTVLREIRRKLEPIRRLPMSRL